MSVHKRVFNIDPAAFLPFNDSPDYLSGEVAREIDSVTIRGTSRFQLQGWHDIGGRTVELLPHSFSFSASVLPTKPLGACSLGIRDVRGVPRIHVSHFIKSSSSLHKAVFEPNFYSGFGFDAANRRTQTGVGAPWNPVNRHHNFAVEYRPDEETLACFANGMQVHKVHGRLWNFQLEILVEAVAVDGEFSFRFERLQYMDFDCTGEQNRLRLNAWDQSYPPVFVSYAHADRPVVEKLRETLRSRAIRVLGDWDLGIGDSLLDRLSDFISSSGCVLVLLSPASVSSRWVQQELQQAMNEELDRRSKRVLPVLIEDCDLPPYLRGRLYADLRASEKENLDRMLQTIRNLGVW